MSQQTIGIGTTANDGTGDTARVAFDKVNDNFTELYPVIASVTADTTLTAVRSLTLVDATAGNVTITLPAAASAAVASVKKTDATAYTVTVDGAGAETVNGDASVVISYQDTLITLLSDGSGWHMG